MEYDEIKNHRTEHYTTCTNIQKKKVLKIHSVVLAKVSLMPKSVSY